MRDVGGLPTEDGRAVRGGRLLRSDSLQELTDADVRRLVDELRVRAVADLRTGVEVDSEGPGPLTRRREVAIRHLSLFPEVGRTTDAEAVDDAAQPDERDAGPVVLPWQGREAPDSSADERRRGASGVYLRYLDDRADSILAALRLIAYTDGATIVHCAAGKDRTGVVVALALSEVGVDRAAIVEDYARSAERVAKVYARLSARPTYREDLENWDVDKHRPRAETMVALLSAIDDIHGGAAAWLRSEGWTDDDAAALRRALLG